MSVILLDRQIHARSRIRTHRPGEDCEHHDGAAHAPEQAAQRRDEGRFDNSAENPEQKSDDEAMALRCCARGASTELT
jgi:hypothetical protein